MSDKMNTIDTLITQIITNNPDFKQTDTLYLRNKIIGLVGENKISFTTKNPTSVKELVSILTDDEIIQSQLLDLYTPKPSTINKIFWDKYKINPDHATNFFHQLSIENNYLQVDKIAQNIKFISPSKYGKLEITINLSKPEKTTKQIMTSAKIPKRLYPKCQLCFENEGYLGGNDYPLRSQHRLIRMKLNNKEWGLQYSPYEYFDEHIIVIDKVHEPMNISSKTFKNLFDFVDLFPQYFLGSNAGIPIVGGSMLNHEHYQGGKHIFPVENSKNLFKFDTKIDGLQASVLDWPVSTIKLTSTNRSDLEKYCSRILTAWMKYNNNNLNITAEKDGIKHHSINPIVRKFGQTYHVLIMLRDNNTSAKFPDGIFHVHPEYQHIKQENIGLIEAMGLAILPGRLKQELLEVKNFLLNQENQIAPRHQVWAEELKSKLTPNDRDIDLVLKNELGSIFEHILENTGVFYNQPEQFKKFTDTI